MTTGDSPDRTPPWVSGNYPNPLAQLPHRSSDTPSPPVRTSPALLGDGVIIRTGYQALHLTREQWNTWTTEIKSGAHDTA